MEILIPQFNSLDEFIAWCQSSEIQNYLKTNPQLLEQISNLPQIKTLLEEFNALSANVKTAPSSRSQTDTLRLLTMSNPQDKQFISEVVLQYHRQKASIQRGGGVTDAPAAETVAFEELRSFGRYRIQKKIAEGGFGAVYLAYDPQLDRSVALKLLKLRTEEEIGHFESEAKLAAKLRHPNIIPVHELGVLDNQPYFTMDYIEGKTLRKLLDESSNRALSVDETFRIILPVLDALSYAHANGIIHRDIKPENIFIDNENRIYIGDFGIAKRVEGRRDGAAKSSRIVGTPQYMSPEQANGEEIDARSDIWAVGVLLYESLSGQCPFDSDVIVEVFKKIWFSEPLSLRSVCPKIDRDVETIVFKCLQKEPSRRYQSVLELKEDIGRYLKGEAIEARPISIVERLWRRVRRNKIASLGVGVAMVALIVVGFVLLRHSEVRHREVVRKKAEEILKKLTMAATLEEKIKLVEEAISSDPTYLVPYLEKGKILKEENRENEALAAFENAVVVAQRGFDKEGEAVAHFYMGMIYWQKQDYIAGLEHFKKVLKLMPNVCNPMTLYAEASEAYHQGRYEKSIRFIEEVLRLRPDFPEAFNMRGAARMQLRDLDGAFADYSRAIELNNKFAEAYSNRGSVRYIKGDYDGAVRDYDIALQLNPRLVIAYSNRGAAKCNKGDYEGGIADYKKAIEISPDFFFGYYNLACAYANMGNKGNALEALKKAFDLDRSGRLKKQARSDKDLDSLREDEEFKRLLGE